MEDESLNMEF